MNPTCFELSTAIADQQTTQHSGVFSRTWGYVIKPLTEKSPPAGGDEDAAPRSARWRRRKFVCFLIAAGCLAFTTPAALQVVNGDFSDLTGLTPGNDGWFTGVPAGWAGSGRAYAVNTNYGPTPPTANPSQLGHLRQQIGTVDRRSDVVLTFDVSAPWKPDGLLNVSILDDQLNPLAGGNFPAGPNQQLTAKAVPAGTALTILFQALQSTPGLDNVTVTARPAKRSRAARVKTTKAPVTVAAYYYPCTHPHPRWDSAKYPGFTEWDLVRAARPRFPGHQQPQVPLWGYGNESRPEVMAQKIAAAADCGLNAFIFDWYYYDDGPYLERALDEGFLRATNNARLQFALMWANHDWYDIQGYNPADNNLKLLYPGKVTPATWDKICDLVIERYFRHPSYWRVEDRPYFSIYEMSQFLESFGSVEGARAALDRFRAKVRAAGFPGVHLNAILWGEPNLPGGKTSPGWPKLCRELALDSLSGYTWVHHGALNYQTFPVSDYVEGRNTYLLFWAGAQTAYPVPYFPNVMIGWDNSPRAHPEADWRRPALPVVNPVVLGNTPAAFKESLALIKARLLAAPTQPKILTINAWNEWPEGSCLEPTQAHGYGYLEAVQEVFPPAKKTTASRKTGKKSP